MPEPHNHHYVPQFYQRGFTADGGNQIWVYRRETEPRQYYTKKTGMKIDLYAFSKQGQRDFGTVEKQLAVLDDKAAKVIQKVEKELQPNEKERGFLSRFVSVMWRRTPRHLDHVNKIAANIMTEVFEPFDRSWEMLSREVQAEVSRLREDYSKQTPDFLFPENVLRESAFETEMMQMDWVFFRAPAKKEFVTCDDPALFSKRSGLQSEDAVIMFPLSKKLFLQCMRKSSWRNRFHSLSPQQVDYLNLCVVKNAQIEVYASVRNEGLRLVVKQNIGAFG